MAETRPSGTGSLPDTGNQFLQEVAEIGTRGRFHILPRWVQRLSWIAPSAEKGVSALLVLAEPGLVSIRNWEPDGPRIVTRYNDLANSPTFEAEALRLIQDTYGKFHIPKDRRAYLGDAALQHLGLPTDRRYKGNVYVFVHSDQIDILSPALRAEKHVAGHPELDDLP